MMTLTKVAEDRKGGRGAEDIAEAEEAPGRLRRAANFAGRHKKKLIAGAALAGLGGWGYQNRKELKQVPSFYRNARTEDGDFEPASRLDALRTTRLAFKILQNGRKVGHYDDRFTDLFEKYRKPENLQKVARRLREKYASQDRGAAKGEPPLGFCGDTKRS